MSTVFEHVESGLAPSPGNHLLAVQNLKVTAGAYEAVREVSLSLPRSASLALVGESGSGKSLTAAAIAGLLAPNLTPTGSVRLEGRELIGQPWRARRQLAGRRIGFVFQEPMSSLHPVLTVGQQIAEGLRAHFDYGRPEREERTRELLALVGLNKGRDVSRNRIGELSGGMRQRVMIAMAISCSPDLLIADEPTTALDVTLQKQIIDLLLQLREDLGLALLLITHDLGVVAETCENAAVMYGGEIVEAAPTGVLLTSPRHAYTKALMAAVPSLGDTRPRLPTIASIAPWLRDARQLPPAERPRTALVLEAPSHWVRQTREASHS
ncbi:MAG TPA: ABC transporter ATP-binding protein [Sinomonas sp.]|nr:ABC transporter ATP-binding protein [Sinomonas sp.]